MCEKWTWKICLEFGIIQREYSCPRFPVLWALWLFVASFSRMLKAATNSVWNHEHGWPIRSAAAMVEANGWLRRVDWDGLVGHLELIYAFCLGVFLKWSQTLCPKHTAQDVTHLPESLGHQTLKWRYIWATREALFSFCQLRIVLPSRFIIFHSSRNYHIP